MAELRRSQRLFDFVVGFAKFYIAVELKIMSMDIHQSVHTRLSAWTTRPQVRIRGSTAFLLLFLITLLTFSSFTLLDHLSLLTTTAREWIDKVRENEYLGVYGYEVAQDTLIIAVLINLISLPLYLGRKKWRASIQAVSEILLCAVCVLLRPTY